MLPVGPQAGQSADVSSCVWLKAADLFAFLQSVSPITQN